MPTLLQINTCLTGSTGRIARQISESAVSLGWDSYIAYGRGKKESCSNYIRIGSVVSVYTHALLSRIFDCSGLCSTLATKRFLKKVDRIKPNVVQLHNIHGYYINYRLLLNYLATKRIPTVITLHDFWLITGHCSYINNCCGKWVNGCENCTRLREYPSALFDHSSYNWKLKKDLFETFRKGRFVVVPVSYWLEAQVRKSIISSATINTIQNGVDIDLFRPFNGPHSELYKTINWTAFTVMTIAAKWTDANGFDDIIQLSELLHGNAQIIMVGVDNCQIKKLPSNIIGIEHIDNIHQLVELYSAADVMFNPSKEVTFGLVTAEALACGTPAIVYKGTAGEEIIDDTSGFVVSNVKEVFQIIQAKETKSSKDCRARVIQHFNSKNQYSSYPSLYQMLLTQCVE